MKRFFLLMTAAVLMGTTAVAQDNRPQFDRTEMIKQRTDQMVEKYKLNETQAKQLLDLNTKNAETMGPMMGMGRMGGGRPGGMGGRRGGGQAGPGGQGAPQMGGGGFQMTEEQRARFEEMRKQREENQKKYDAELEKILTPDQFKSYQEDQKQQREQRGRGMRRGGGGPGGAGFGGAM
jgi:Spy/CpxP family protein refolding chaperone